LFEHARPFLKCNIRFSHTAILSGGVMKRVSDVVGREIFAQSDSAVVLNAIVPGKDNVV